MTWICDRPLCEHVLHKEVARCPKCGCRRLHYLPSPEEIAAACEEIQATWSPRTECSRRVMRPSVYEFPWIADVWQKSWVSEMI